MQALLKAINDMFALKDERIELLEWENKRLKAEIAELKNDIDKYKENEQIEATNVLGRIEEIIK